MTSNGNGQSHWIPAFAGMTSKNNGDCNGHWIPAFAGMTSKGNRNRKSNDGHRYLRPYFLAARICASTAAIAVMLTTRRGVDAGVRMCAGLSRPIRIGPMATPSVITRTML
jgi:hypothetical protein